MLNTFIITELSFDLYRSPIYPNVDIIPSLYFKDLVNIAKNNHIHGYSKKRKNSLTKLILDQIELENNIQTIDSYYKNKLMTDNNFDEVFKKLLENKIKDSFYFEQHF